ncbi:MAG: hypothetical protein QM811_05810 [Pirellulales bacterium]
MAGFLKTAGRLIGRKLKKLFRREQWILLSKRGDALSGSFERFKTLTPPADRFWADPHLIERDGRPYLFAEEYLDATGLGRIVVFECDENGNWISPPQPVLERPYHLSYPFLFEHADELYMLPETAGNRTIEAYRCVEFPHRWEPAAVLMNDVSAVDATLHERDGRWWMFVNLREHPGASSWDELHLFSADSPLATAWTPHPANPIVSDVRSARPAGAIFEADGRWIRPAQDCSGRYGRGLKFMEIITLDERRYEEREVASHYADWSDDLTTIHAFARCRAATVVDAMRKRSRFR